MVSSPLHSKDGSWKLQLAESVYVNKEHAVYARQLENNPDWESLTGEGLVQQSTAELGHRRRSVHTGRMNE